MSYQHVKDFRQRLKERLIYVAGGQCAICGYSKCNSALEFHHLNSKEKDFTLGQNANISFEKAKEEIKKCILVCSNCHREIHSNLLDSTKLKSSYIEERAQEIEQEIYNIKHKQIFYCKSCGKEISKGSNYCPECFSLQRRVIERPNREELKNLIRNFSFLSIGKKYNVTDNAIRKWCKSENLPSRKVDINNYSDEEWKYI